MRLLKNSNLFTSAAKAFIDLKAFTAALKALRHPKTIFSGL